jgi:uncharacterized protein YfaS (alpha-2-macroglobulin family)
MNGSSRFGVGALALPLLVAFVVGCPGARTPVSAPTKITTPTPTGPVQWRVSKSGLGFRVSDADEDGEGKPPKPAPTTPLSDAETKQLFDRMPTMPVDPALPQPFALREKSPPAPRPGKTITDTFPPPLPPSTPPPAANAGPLKVLRHAPEGNIDLAPYLTVTFSAPMVPVTSHAELAKIPVPVQLTPTPKGEWRWLGTQTAMFQPDPRFPMATDYTVEVPAGVKAQNGEALAQPVKWTFSTPAPKLKSYYPSHGPHGITPVMYAEFDQAIDARDVMSKMTVQADGTQVRVRPATQDEIEEDPQVSSLSQRAKAGRFLAFKAEGELPVASNVSIKFPKGTTGTEGPKPTDREQSFGFRTYDPFRLRRSSCGWSDHCVPLTPFYLEMNNPIERRSFEKAYVSVTPAIPGMKVEVSGNTLVVSGKTKGRTKYTVTVSQKLGDTFGQKLVREETATLEVGSAPPTLFSEESDMILLDPASAGKLSVYSVNDPTLKVRIYQVKAEDWPKYLEYRRAWDNDRKVTTPPGKLVFDKNVKTPAAADELVETQLDLASALDKAGIGHAVVVVETLRPQRNKWDKEWVRSWVQSTKIGAHAMTEERGLTVWATDLATGAPLDDVEVVSTEKGARGKTGKDGVARVDATTNLVFLRRGADTALVGDRYSGQIHYPGTSGEHLAFFTFDDRKMYKPGEEVHVKGWVRTVDHGKGGDVKMIPNLSGEKLAWTARDSRGAEAAKGEATVDAGGGFDFVIKLAKNANLGHTRADLQLRGSHGSHGFEVQEFRRPEFEVNVRTTTEGPHFVGGSAIVAAEAKYYAGGGLPNAEVDWNINRSDAHFSPPGHAGWTFGKNDWGFRTFRAGQKRGAERNKSSETWKGRTNPTGTHRIKLEFDALDPPYPMSLSVHGNVQDVNRQSWSGNATLLVHPSSVYVGVKPEKYFVRAGEAIQLDALVADIDGKITAGRKVTIKSARLDLEQRGEEYEEKELDVQTCDLVSGEQPARCTLKTKDGGRHRIVAVVEDESGRKSQTTLSMWVIGGNAPQDRELKGAQAQVIPDKKDYQPGESAELLVLAPFAPAEGIVTVRRAGLLSVERFTMATSMQTVKVKLDDTMLPGVQVDVILAGAAVREDESGVPDPKLGKRPAFARGTAGLAVPPKGRTLTVGVAAREKKIDPGGSTTVDVDVKDAKGSPVPGADVAVVVVDESILALSGYKLPDPMPVFYPHRGAGVADYATRERVVVAHPQEARARMLAQKDASRDDDSPSDGRRLERKSAEIMMNGAAPGAPPPPASPVALATATASPAKPDMAKGKKVTLEDAPNEPNAAITLRTDFSALATFVPKVATDARGHVEVPVKLPDSLTRYRIMAVAAQETRFGAAESTVTARLPLMVRPSAPRFLNFGDKFELPIVLQNQTDKPMDVNVAARALNASIDGPAGRKVTVAANDRVEVRIPASAVKPGTARIQIGAASGKWSDASQVELPVWTPATTEAFATYGVIDQGAIAQRVKMPDGVVTQFGGLEVTTSSTALQALTDAFLYLVRYPFECNEQVASRVMAIAALKDVLAAFKAEGLPKPEELVASVAKDMDRLKVRQHWSGGWGFWFTEPWPYLSVHVTHTLVRAKEKGFAVDPGMLSRAHNHLKNIESYIPAWYSPEARRAIVAYSIYVRKRLGDADVAKAKRVIDESGGVQKTSLETLGWLIPTLSDDKGQAATMEQIRRHLANRVTETAGAAHFVSGYGDGDYLLLNSDRRADGILLESMIGDQPKSDIIPKLVTGLLGHRKAGRWGSTQENAFVLLALDRYFAKYEGTTPDFVAKVWLGDRYAGDHQYKGRTTERHHIDVPMKLLADVKEGDLTIAKDGPGRLYFRVGMQYAPADLKPPPMDRGFTVTRKYEAVDKPEDVKRDADGTWRFKAGAKVRVRVTMVAPARRHHVALVDPIPAGIEPMNPALAVTGPIPQDPNAAQSSSYWWSRTWYEHQNMRDERVEAFASLLWDGVHEYVYVARATTPGTFVVPPPKAEEMYSPEVFGRGPGDRVIVAE